MLNISIVTFVNSTIGRVKTVDYFKPKLAHISIFQTLGGNQEPYKRF